MKVLVDTNVMISALLNPNGTAAKALYKTSDKRFSLYLSDYCIDEFKRIMLDKFPHRQHLLNDFLTALLKFAHFLKTPDKTATAESQLNDVNDRPILRAAMAEKIDVILTGDNGFLKSGIKNPRMISTGEFLAI